MLKFLAAIESTGFYSAEDPKIWVQDFRKATWFDTLEEAQKIPAEYYLCADIEVHENPNHSYSPLIQHRLGKYLAYCRHCNQPYGQGQYTRVRAIQRYASEVHGKCQTVILISLQNAVHPRTGQAKSLAKYKRPEVVQWKK